MKLSFKSISRFIGNSAVFAQAVRLFDRLPFPGGPRLRVLTYHRVDFTDSRADLDPSLISATPPQFERQISWLKRDFDLVSGEQILLALTDQRPLPARPLLITFDDAYQDFAIHALPVLQRHSAPAVMFVPTAYPDGSEESFWWDRLYCSIVGSECTGPISCSLGTFKLGDTKQRTQVFRELKRSLKSFPHLQMLELVDNLVRQMGADKPSRAVMSWEYLRKLPAAGVMLAPHTHTHPLLDRLPLADAIEEINKSRDLLERHVGSCPPLFAYPSGHCSGAIVQALQSAGFMIAFTTFRGVNHLSNDHPLRMRRNNVGRLTPDNLLLAQLIEPAILLNRALPANFSRMMEAASS